MRGWSTPALAVAVGAALVAPGHVAAAVPSVRSGPLTAHVDGAGALRLLQRGGATLRQESGFLRFHTYGHSMPAGRLVGRRRIHDGRSRGSRAPFPGPARERRYDRNRQQERHQIVQGASEVPASQCDAEYEQACRAEQRGSRADQRRSLPWAQCLNAVRVPQDCVENLR